MRDSCSKCGASPKDGSHYSYCKSCFAAYVRERYEPNPRRKLTDEELSANAKARSRRWYLANRERVLEEERVRRMTTLDGEAQRKRSRRYYEQNHDRFLAYSRHRKATKRAHTVEYVDPIVVLEAADGVCGICGHDVDPFNFEVDHIIPVSRGGEHSYANTQPSHRFCNRSKGARILEAA